ncbi:hypothetical protein HDK90DRAFT_490739 [Phyllosticta capitalensis]|uniref:Secreted protein n=1 Tax=Phyllosticta capitalensis TaxID=121624 RepID=A0ABR1YHQ1_9PEZI
MMCRVYRVGWPCRTVCLLSVSLVGSLAGWSYIHSAPAAPRSGRRLSRHLRIRHMDGQVGAQRSALRDKAGQDDVAARS